MKLFEGAVIEIRKECLEVAREMGEDVSYTEAGRHIEAYAYRGNIYIGKITSDPPRSTREM